jgi:pSer/pThr/pTyr-binding forkhead associated (FHA) protein
MTALYQMIIGTDAPNRQENLARVQLADRFAAPSHVLVTQHADGSIDVSDLNSPRGTWILRRGATQYQRIAPGARRPLYPGDQVKIGRTIIPYAATDPPVFHVP